jgi:hypothetical protein
MSWQEVSYSFLLDVVQVTFYFVLSAWDFGFFYVYYSLLLPIGLRERDKFGFAMENQWPCSSNRCGLKGG